MPQLTLVPPFKLLQKIMEPGAKPFQAGREEDAGWDIWGIERVEIKAGGSAIVRTGIATAFPMGWVGLIFDRSSTGVKGLMRRAGVIDSGFRAEWRVVLFNSGSEWISIDTDKAIAQVVFVPYGKGKCDIVAELPSSERGMTWDGASDKG